MTDGTDVAYCLICDDGLDPADAVLSGDHWLCVECYDTQSRAILEEVLEERGLQDAKWGQQNHPDLYWLGIAMEEVGEVAKAIIEEQPPDAVRQEIIQATAVLVAWLQAMYRRPLAVRAQTQEIIP